MPKKPTRIATLETFTVAFVRLSTLLPTGFPTWFEDVTMTNKGDVAITVSFTGEASESPTSSGQVDIPVDGELTVAALSTYLAFVKTADAGVVNKLEFYGTPTA